MRVLMLVATSVSTDNRVLREARALVAAGHTVHVVGKDVPEDFVPPAGVTVSSAGASSVFRPAGAPSLTTARLSAPKRLARWILLPTHRNQMFRSWAAAAVRDGRGREFDVVHAHDFTALEAGASLATDRGVPYVYDSHELWSGQERQYRPTPLQDRRERTVEARLGGAAAAVVTVSDGIAEVLRRRYGWEHVVVVRNSFPRRPDDGSSLPDAPRGMVYAGRIDAHRDLEVVLAATKRLPDLPLTLVGPANDAWLADHAEELDAAGARVRAALPVDDATTLLRSVGLSLVTLSDRFEGHLLAMPNKVFHAVQAGVPVVVADLPELAALVRRYDLGEMYRPGDARALADAVNRVRERYASLVRSVDAARGPLSWDADAAVLVGVYERLGARGAVP